jgi:hypothetical protein
VSDQAQNRSGVRDVPQPGAASFLISAVCRAVVPLRLQSKMRTITVKLPPEANFSFEMAGMHEWLDKYRCAPSRFKYHRTRSASSYRLNSTKKRELRSSNDILTKERRFRFQLVTAAVTPFILSYVVVYALAAAVADRVAGSSVVRDGQNQNWCGVAVQGQGARDCETASRPGRRLAGSRGVLSTLKP